MGRIPEGEDRRRDEAEKIKIYSPHNFTGEFRKIVGLFSEAF